MRCCVNNEFIHFGVSGRTSTECLRSRWIRKRSIYKALLKMLEKLYSMFFHCSLSKVRNLVPYRHIDQLSV
ncbi:hypothetical protein GW17_00025629 [Ensete ventricosum]|nr:hypothetical protein GW17_00025629 [Ensete ventricosum]